MALRLSDLAASTSARRAVRSVPTYGGGRARHVATRWRCGWSTSSASAQRRGGDRTARAPRSDGAAAPPAAAATPMRSAGARSAVAARAPTHAPHRSPQPKVARGEHRLVQCRRRHVTAPSFHHRAAGALTAPLPRPPRAHARAWTPSDARSAPTALRFAAAAHSSTIIAVYFQLFDLIHFMSQTAT